MGLGYNPEDKEEGGGRAAAGEYDFVVDDAEETTFRSGNDGLKVKLMVGAFDDRDVTVFDRFVYLPSSLWKLEEFLASIGCDFNNSPNAHEIIGMQGRASFVPGDRGYIEAETYIAASANNAPSRSRSSANYDPPPGLEPPPLTDDDCPL
jgi:hypothetical protein